MTTTSSPGDKRFEPMLSHPGRRLATRREAAAWWTVSPVFVLDDRPELFAAEQILVVVDDPPEADGAEFTAVYDDGTADLSVDSLRHVMARGGVAITGNHHHWPAPPVKPERVRLHVGDYPAMVSVALKSSGSLTEIFFVRWYIPTDHGHVAWSLMGDPNHYNERQAIALAKTIVELSR